MEAASYGQPFGTTRTCAPSLSNSPFNPDWYPLWNETSENPAAQAMATPEPVTIVLSFRRARLVNTNRRKRAMLFRSKRLGGPETTGLPGRIEAGDQPKAKDNLNASQ